MNNEINIFNKTFRALIKYRIYKRLREKLFKIYLWNGKLIHKTLINKIYNEIHSKNITWIDD